MSALVPNARTDNFVHDVLIAMRHRGRKPRANTEVFLYKTPLILATNATMEAMTGAINRAPTSAVRSALSAIKQLQDRGELFDGGAGIGT